MSSLTQERPEKPYTRKNAQPEVTYKYMGGIREIEILRTNEEHMIFCSKAFRPGWF